MAKADKTSVIRKTGEVRKSADGKVTGFANFRSVDRYGDLVLPSAFAKSKDAFMKNPVFALGHDISGDPKGGLPIGSIRSLKITDDGPEFEAEFAGTPDAQLVQQLFDEGHMRAFSIGFFLVEGGTRDPTEDELKEFGVSLRRVITDLELIEISAVPVPANRESLTMAFKALSDAGYGTPVTIMKDGSVVIGATQTNDRDSIIKAAQDLVASLSRKAVSDDAKEAVAAVAAAWEAWLPSLKTMQEANANLVTVTEDGEAEDGDLLASAEAYADALTESSAQSATLSEAVNALVEQLGGDSEDEDDDDESSDDDDPAGDDEDDNEEDAINDDDLKAITAQLEKTTKAADERVAAATNPGD